MSVFPRDQALNVIAHSHLMALPLRDADVPCGHVTLVSAMHLGKAVIATDSAALRDYVTPGVTALTCAVGDEEAWLAAIRLAYDDPAMSRRLGLAAQEFARVHCVEERVIDYFRRFIDNRS